MPETAINSGVINFVSSEKSHMLCLLIMPPFLLQKRSLILKIEHLIVFLETTWWMDFLSDN
jgi:hypothetical protein